MRVFFDVTFPLAMPRDALTYHHEQTEEDPVPRPGCRVVASIQRRPVIGYILAVHDHPPEFKTLPILQIADYWPLLSPAMIDLGIWMSKTCFCSPGEAYHAMLPSGIKQKIVRSVTPGIAARKRQDNGEELPGAVVWLITNGSIPIARFFKTFPQVSKRMGAWIEQGLIEITHARSETAKPKVNRMLVLVDDVKLAIDALTPKERQVVEYLLKVNAPVNQAEIRRRANVSQAPVDQLLRKGILGLRYDRVVREVATESYYLGEPAPIPLLTEDQQKALDCLRRSEREGGKPALIWGVTCSGKTEVYLRWVAEKIASGRGAIVLVPEISLTPQMTKRFRDRFGKQVAILHSRLSDGERFDQWEQIRAGECLVVVGARSAVFAPVRNLGTIIIDEEGEPSFKQADSPRYHAREVAAKRCELEKALLVMGSATPTMEAFYGAQSGRFELARMPKRVGERLSPLVEVVDMRLELTAKQNRSMFSGALSRAVEETLNTGKQIILYLNRRGYSSFVLCRACGQVVECSRCGISLVYHSGSSILRCHYCGEARPIPQQCNACQSRAIKYFGAGTQRIEAETRRYFPKARVQRLDSDSVAASGSIEDILEKFGKREIDILIGTQMVAKGLDFPDVTLIGIMAADGLLRLPDFRASERNFSLLAQVSGRAGRGDSPGKVVLQTYFPDHHSIQHALTENYLGFFEEESKHRLATNFPPYKNVAMILLVCEKAEKARQIGENLVEAMKKIRILSESEIIGPAPAPLERLNMMYRFQIFMKFPETEPVTMALKSLLSWFPASGVRIAVDVNPFFAL